MLPMIAKVKLSLMLDAESPGRDWRALAERLGYSRWISGFQVCPTPTRELLSYFEVRLEFLLGDTCLHTRIHKCMHAYMHAHTTHTHTHTHTHTTHTHTHTHAPPHTTQPPPPPPHTHSYTKYWLVLSGQTSCTALFGVGNIEHCVSQSPFCKTSCTFLIHSSVCVCYILCACT